MAVRLSADPTKDPFKSDEKGPFGIAVGLVSNHEAMAKTTATAFDVVRAITDIQEAGSLNLGDFGKALMGAAPICSISKGAVAALQTGGRVYEGKYDSETLGGAFKVAAEAADVALWASKTGSLDITAGTTYGLKVVKGVGQVGADVAGLYKTVVIDAAKVEETAKTDTNEVHEAKTDENWYATLRGIAGFALHLFMAMGAILSVALSPMIITILATVYIVAINVHEIVKGCMNDLISRTDAKTANDMVKADRAEIARLQAEVVRLTPGA